MGRTVVVAEKPSVGRDIARVLGCRDRGDGCLMGGNWVVTWAVGHLVTLCEPDEMDEKYKRWQFATLPILPEDIPLKVIPSSKKQFKIVKDLINDKETDRLVCATDAGREGELIFRYIYQQAKCKKPFDRLWISSMTDEAIQEGFRNMKSGQAYDGLYASAKCRSQADWLVGMNASRAFTLKYDALLSVGRVQTPTLAILVKRRQEIEQFKPEEYATLTADFGDYTGLYFHEKLDPDSHIPTGEAAQKIADEIKGKEGRVLSAKTTRKKELPPQLFDLTSLQREANKLFGFSADKPLGLAQSLYEDRKALTYPRTDSRYLPPDMIPRVVQTLKMLPDAYATYVPGALPGGRLPVSGRTVDASKVTDHHAIIPTNKRVDPSTFPEDERKLYDLVVRRLLAAFHPACEFDATQVITQVESHRFRTNGRVVIVNGWHDVPATSAPAKAKKKSTEEQTVLPPLQEGDVRTVKKATVKLDMTKPPFQHNDASLLDAMEHAGRELEDKELQKQMKGSGIGTPATRASIIERLIHVGYVQRQGKNLLATDKGVRLISVMPPEITSPEMTGRWEQALDKITDGQQDAGKFMESIRKFSAFLVTYAKEQTAQVQFPDDRGPKGRRGKFASKKVPDCLCPMCQSAIEETPLSYKCTNKECPMTLWKDCLTRGGGPMLNEKVVQLLLKSGEVRGSTGVVTLKDGQIAFWANGDNRPRISRSIVYHKK